MYAVAVILWAMYLTEVTHIIYPDSILRFSVPKAMPKIPEYPEPQRNATNSPLRIHKASHNHRQTSKEAGNFIPLVSLLHSP